MDTIKIQVEVGFSETAASILRGILGNGQQQPAAPAAPARETKPSPAQVAMETKHNMPMDQEPQGYDGPVDDPTLRAAVTAAVKRTNRDLVKAHLQSYEWYKSSSVDCPMEQRAALITNLNNL